MRADLVLLFSVAVSSRQLNMYEIETSQIYEKYQEFQPIFIPMMDNMKDILDDMKNIQKEMVMQTCQTTERSSLHEYNPAHIMDMEGASARTFCNTQLTENYRDCRKMCANLTFSSRVSCRTSNWWSFVSACLGGREEIKCPNVTMSNTAETKPTNSTSDCDYSTFGSDHTMNLSEKDSCGPNNYSGVSASEINTILNKHNTLRAKVANGLETQGCLGPQPSATNMLEMRWNSQLAEVAQAWADQCQNPQNPHDSSNNRKICDSDYHVGQNIYFAWGFDSASAWEDAIDGWYNEVKDMPSSLVSRFGSNTCSTREVIGHYTQVVWAATNEVGCGGIHYQTTRGGTTYPESKIYVCNYGPGGNFLGSPLYESGATASNCPSGRGASADYPGLCA